MLLKYTLSNTDINSLVEEVRAIARKNEADGKSILSVCLALEETLLNYRDGFGSGQEIKAKVVVRGGAMRVTLEVPGKSYNALREDDEGTDDFIISSIDIAPKYYYANRKNYVVFNLNLNRGGKELRTIFLSVTIGVIIGVLGKQLPGEAVSICQILTGSLSDAIFGLMRMAALPVVFLCVVYGIIGSGSVSGFRDNGLVILRHFLLSMLLMLLTCTAFSAVAFGIRISGSSSGLASYKSLVENLFAIIPDNIFSPFMNGDNVKVIILGVIFGVAVLALGEKVSMIGEINSQLKDICSFVLMLVGKCIPVLIVTVLVNNIWSGSVGAQLLTLWRIVGVYLVTVAVILTYEVLAVARVRKIKPQEVLRALVIPGVKGLASASSMFCYSDMVDSLDNKLHVSKSTVNFGLPLGIAFYQPIVILYAVFVLYFAAVAGVEINLTWIVSFLIICFFTSIAAPPVSGGSVSLLAVLFAALSIPEAAVAVACPLFMLMDYPNTGFRVMMLILEVAKDSDGK